MQFNDTTNKNGLIQDCELLLGWNDGAITGDTTRLKQFTSLINQAYHKASAKIIRASSPGWKWDDLNYTSNFPRGTQDLVVGQHDYTLPTATGTYSAANATTLLTVDGIAILDQNGYEKKLELTDLSEAELNLLYATNGTPAVYKLIKGSAKLWPAPATGEVTTSNGFIAYFQRTVSEFASTDTTKQPGFAAPFHRIISLQASLDYANRPGLTDRIPYIESQLLELTAELESFTANRNRDDRIRVVPANRKTSYN
jgi:hypothetical protein